MIKKPLLLFVSLIILLHCQVAAAFSWSTIHPSIITGYGYTTTGHTQSLWLADTPEPGLQNTYSNGGQQLDTTLLGIALEKNFTTNLTNLESTIGIEADYLRNLSVTGVVRPMINVDPDFDTLNYSYRMQSYLLLATAKLSMLNILPSLGAYLQAGAGEAINTLSDYTETSPPGSSAAPMLSPFDNASHTKFAYSIGAGILCPISKSMRILIGYRYINSGLGGFKTSPVQQTNNTLKFTPLVHHFLTLSFII